MEEVLKIRDTAQPVIHCEWFDLFKSGAAINQLENHILPAYLKRMRWFGGKSRPFPSVVIYQNIPIAAGSDFVHYLLLKVRYPDFPTEIYALPVNFVPARQFQDIPSEAVIARLENSVSPGYITDALFDEAFQTALYLMVKQEKYLNEGHHYPVSTHAGKLLLDDSEKMIHSRLLHADQSNSAIIYNERLFLKFFRKLEYEKNPDLELTRFLTEQGLFRQIPAYAGSIEIHHPEKPAMLAVLLQQLVPNEGNAWDWFLNRINLFYSESGGTNTLGKPFPARPAKHQITWEETPEILKKLIGEEVFQMAYRLGCRTAELHRALGNEKILPAFKPERANREKQHAYAQALTLLIDQKTELLQRNLLKIPDAYQQGASELIAAREDIKAFVNKTVAQQEQGMLIRTHGDYHLGQVLIAKDDLFILDFEGEPDKPHIQRIQKNSPLKDVAGMMRSFRYVAYASLMSQDKSGPETREQLLPLADLWYHFVSRYFLGAYLECIKDSGLIPQGADFNAYLQLQSIEKTVYELGYEINNRPEWTIIPLLSLIKFVRFYLHPQV